MPTVKACTEICSSTPDALAEDIASRIRAAVQWRRWLGAKLEHAMDQASIPLRITARRVQSFVRGEVNGIPAAEYRALRDAICRDREEHIAELRAVTARLEREADADVIGQLSLPLEEIACGSGFAGGDGRRLSRGASGGSKNTTRRN